MIFEFDHFKVDTLAFEVRCDDTRLDAQPQVIELLVMLLDQQDRVVSRDEIFDQVWKGRIVSDTALSSRIKTIRQLLGDDGDTQKYIRTVHGRGFQFVGNAARSGDVEETVIPFERPQIKRPQTRYAKSGDIHVAYQVFGDGPVNMVIAPGFVSHIDNYWDSPDMAKWLSDMARFATIAMFDKRGTGLSDSVSNLPGMDERMDDVRAVMDAVGWQRTFILGISEGGSLAALFAASYPERTLGIILYGAFAKFSSWISTQEGLQEFFDYIETHWGTGISLPNFAPCVGEDPDAIEWWGKFERLGATPGAAIALMEMNSQIDISNVLPTIQVPALVVHCTEDVLIDFEGGQYLADNIPNAKLVAFPGPDHLAWFGDNTDQITATIAEFLREEIMDEIPDTVLTTVLSVHIRGGALQKEWSEAADGAISHRITRFRGKELSRQTNVASPHSMARRAPYIARWIWLKH